MRDRLRLEYSGKSVKLGIRVHLVPILRCVELYFRCSVHLLAQGRYQHIFWPVRKTVVCSDCWLRHVCLSLRNRATPTGWFVVKLNVWGVLQKFTDTLLFGLKSDKSDRHITLRPTYVYNLSP